jgi:hypothetical protein
MTHACEGNCDPNAIYATDTYSEACVTCIVLRIFFVRN